MDSYCIILLRSYNYDTHSTMIQIKKTVKNNLISPIEFNPISYIEFNPKQFAKATRISTRFHPFNST